MSKLFVRAALIGCATAGAAVAQTAPPPPPSSTTAPTVSITARVTATAPAEPVKMILKTFDVADLVCPPADSPLAKPGNDPAMIAAAKAYTETRAAEVCEAARKRTPEAVSGFGNTGTVEMTSDGKTLVVRNRPEVVDRVGACVESMRQLRSACVKVEMVVVKVPSKNEAMAKLLGEKGQAAVSADEFNVVLRELKASGEAKVLSQPTLMMHNKQTGFCQVGGQVAVPAPDGVVTFTPVGVTSRVTPEVSADQKSVALALEFVLSECVGGSTPPSINCQQMKSNLVLPDGGTMMLKVGTLKEERRFEQKVPVVSDIPYMGRLFRNVSSTTEPVDTVAVITATRVNGHEFLPTPPMMRPAAPPVMAPTVTLTPTVARLAPLMPPVMAAPASLTTVPYATPLPATPAYRVVGTNGLERIGVDFTTLTTADKLPKAVTGVRVEGRPGTGTHLYKFSNGDVVAVTGGTAAATGCCTAETCDATCSLMTAYQAACAAGNKDEAARLAVQLLAKDPTCFGKK